MSLASQATFARAQTPEAEQRRGRSPPPAVGPSVEEGQEVEPPELHGEGPAPEAPSHQNQVQEATSVAAGVSGARPGAPALAPSPEAHAGVELAAPAPAVSPSRSLTLGVAGSVCPVSDPPVRPPAAVRPAGGRRPSLRSQHGLAPVEVGGGGDLHALVRMQDVAVWRMPPVEGRGPRSASGGSGSVAGDGEAATSPSPRRPGVTPPPSSADGRRPSPGTVGEWRTQLREGLGERLDSGFGLIPEDESLASGAVGRDPLVETLSQHSAGVQVAMDSHRGVGSQTVEDRGTQASLEALPAYLDVPYEKEAGAEGGRRRGKALAAVAAGDASFAHSGSSLLGLPTILSREDVREIARAVVQDATSQWQLHAARHTDRALARSLPQVEKRVTDAAQRVAAAEAAAAHEPVERVAQEVASLRQECAEMARRLRTLEQQQVAARINPAHSPWEWARGGQGAEGALDDGGAAPASVTAPAPAPVDVTVAPAPPPPPSLAVTSATLAELAEQMGFLGGGGERRSSPARQDPRSANASGQRRWLHSSGRVGRSDTVWRGGAGPLSRGGEATSSAQSVWDAAPFIGAEGGRAPAEGVAPAAEGVGQEGSRGADGDGRAGGAEAGSSAEDVGGEGEGPEEGGGERGEGGEEGGHMDAAAAREMQQAIEDKLAALASQVSTRALPLPSPCFWRAIESSSAGDSR